MNTISTERIPRAARALVSRFTAPRPSIEERMAAGKTLRAQVPRASHAELDRARERDPLGIILAQAQTRLPELVPIRHARMLSSPFAFLRGSAAVMAADLAATPNTGLRVQACGDMHVSNFGVFASAERNLVFAINDFDETLPGPWEWDLKRLTASAQVAARHLQAGRSMQEAAVRATVGSYQRWMRRYARMGHLELWYSRIDTESLLKVLSPEVRRGARKVLAKARSRNNLQVLDRMTDLVDDQHRIVEARPLIVREKQTAKGLPINDALGLVVESYVASLQLDRRQLLERYRIIDVARKVVGVGSVGTRCWVILFYGNDHDDPLFLQFKEAQPSVLAPYFPRTDTEGGEGRRVVLGQRLIQGSPDIFLGWGEAGGTQFYMRQLRDMKGGAELEPGKTKVPGFVEYCGLCGWALALAHAKSGDAAMIAGYIGKSGELEDALVNFSAAYADLTEQDHRAMKAAARAGRIAVAQVAN